MLCKWEELPKNMQTLQVKKYYDSLKSKSFNLICKFIFDKVMSFIMLIILVPVFLIIAVIIKLDSDGDVFFRQVRVTQYGKYFKIYKFRTMVNNAEKIGSQVTTKDDMRVTEVGQYLRKYRLDELPQLINILKGEMSFVGTRPEVPRYVDVYTPEMLATLLLPAGVTSNASIEYKDENKLLAYANDIDRVYINDVLPQKMYWNLQEILKFSFLYDLKVMIKTVKAVI